MHKLLPSALAAACFALPVGAQSLQIIRVAEGFQRPTFLCSAPGDAERLFVTDEKQGIYVIRNGAVLPEKFLDLSAEIAPSYQGISGLDFHPDYAQNGRFYVVYQNLDNESLVVEYTVSSDPDVADPATAKVLLGPVQQPENLHNWNQVEFGPDGMLYICTGDGGIQGDPNNHAQDLSTTLGKILRIDVDLPPPHVPPDNPFVGMPGVEEAIWSYGLREPWRMSFDRLTGDLWIADVGWNSWEEVSFQPASSTGGENYGWRCMEGAHCTSLGSCACDDPTWTEPVHEYPHEQGLCCVIGGYVYRGAEIPWLQGAYVFGDYCTGTVWSLRYDGTNVTEFIDWSDELNPCDGTSFDVIYSFGQDAAGELYVIDGIGSEIYKIVPDTSVAYTYCPVVPNSAGAGATIYHLGTTSWTANDFVLTAAGAVHGQFGVFYYGENQIQIPFGDGFRCVEQGVQRLYPPILVDGQGVASRRVDLTNPAGPGTEIPAGATRSFQFWYRDLAGPGGSGFNLSDALRAVFCP